MRVTRVFYGSWRTGTVRTWGGEGLIADPAAGEHTLMGKIQQRAL